MHFERANSPQKALQVFDEELIKLNLHHKLSSIGNGPKTTRCWLFDSNNSVADIGNGKGIGLQSEVSAKYEALEHYVSTQKSLLRSQCLAFSLEEIEGNLSQLNREILPINFKSRHKIKTTPWIPLKGFFYDSSILLPYFLINPDYHKQTFSYDDLDYTTLSEISTNNGTAIGTNFDEAMLHAINELIERDAISCFLLASFVKKIPQPIRLVSKASLPYSIFRIICSIEQDYDEELLIVDISTDLEFPVFLASFTSQNQLIQPIGFGASLSPSHALERAVLEALQAFHLYDDTSKLEDQEILIRFNQWPKLHQCAQCDIKSVVEAGQFKKNKFLDLENTPTGIKNTLLNTVTALEKQKLLIYYAEHYLSENGITCVKVVIPGLEQFHRVRYGNFTIPGERGRIVLLN
jgi:ribosomal protein S12 methylthiotransferase accessory factor